MENMKIGILTSGGDCPGLNAVIRAIGKYIFLNMPDAEVYGISDGYTGLINGVYRRMKQEDFSGILNLGGTILGTIRQPFKMMTVEENGSTKLSRMVDNYKKFGFDCIFTLGGAGTHKTAALLYSEGCRVIGLPKTIDNDIFGTDVTFGFHSALDIATECIDRIHTTAASHGRTMFIEIMGNKVGWLTLGAGIAGGADMIILPEIPFTLEAVAKGLKKRLDAGKSFNIVAIAEGAVLKSEADMKKKDRSFARKERGEATVTNHLAQWVNETLGVETRVIVPGHIQRGGSPSAYDRLLSTRLGSYAAALCKEGRFGVTAAVRNGQITYNALPDIAGKTKFVSKNDQAIAAARSIGICFGDEE
ncbi:MAG TPA: ATP-dependent 6-phosphofructokinase [Candidatus Faeciplasma avium]|uniref:ATP-dependent 6-phosphofructokinase n=1 Tax=Candidatus Faeciplasma avium TaxID=2840798 RepID=A0A9D1T3U9_9FIRM|nr:ATP-dependent 6-phosphofructokinase [Candidatus Faeciplasma avium]